MKNVLITGASGGFGLLITRALLEKGYTVIATMRDIESRNKEKAAELEKKGAVVIEMDVVNDDSVKTAVNTAIEKSGKLYAVIQNAGQGVLGYQEFFTIDDFKKLFDLNVFGVQRVTRAVLPHMRENKSGLLMFVSSLLGRITIPFYGPYNASKWALEAMAENYRAELSQFGIESVIVEPGGYPTDFGTNLMKPGDTSRAAGYGDAAQAPEYMFGKFAEALQANPNQNPQHVADTVAEILNAPHGERPFRTVVDSMGMGDAVKDYNVKLDQVTQGLYNAFGMAHMLEVK